MVDVVGDQDDAEAAIARLGDQAQHDGGLVDAERRGRLVEDQDLGAEMHRPGDRQALPLAARQRADRLRGIAHVDADRQHLVVAILLQ